MRYWSCDFETTTDIDDCRVWLWAARDYDSEQREWGIDIDSFFQWAQKQKGAQMSFHNLKFDGSFICDALLKRGYECVPMGIDKLEPGQFTVLVSDMGQWYFFDICFRNGTRIKIVDSLKLLPFKVAKIAKDFHMEMSKGEIDYTMYRPVGYQPTPEELDYVFRDVDIVAVAMRQMREMGDDKITIGSCALSSCKAIMGEKRFRRLFPKPWYDHDVRQAYRGGWTFANPIFQDMEIGEGDVYDVNSLYPFCMAECMLPYGAGVFHEGKIEPDDYYPLTIQRLRCSFELKPRHLPMIQIKGSPIFPATEYLASSKGLIVELCLTCVDLKLFFEHYYVYDLEYVSGWKFQGKTGLFKEYVEHWTAEKIKAKKEKNYARYILAKLHLNSCYGKLGSSPRADVKLPKLEEDGHVSWHIAHMPDKDVIYIPAAVFITAWARDKTIRAAQANFDNFLYSDTDSIHLKKTDKTPDLDIDPYRLGAWDHEMAFKRGKYLHAKCYIEEGYCELEPVLDYKGDPELNEDGTPKMKKSFVNYKTDITKLKVTVAGLPEGCHDQVTWENFGFEAKYEKKKKPVIVPGGTVLLDTTFKVKKK